MDSKYLIFFFLLFILVLLFVGFQALDYITEFQQTDNVVNGTVENSTSDQTTTPNYDPVWDQVSILRAEVLPPPSEDYGKLDSYVYLVIEDKNGNRMGGDFTGATADVEIWSAVTTASYDEHYYLSHTTNKSRLLGIKHFPYISYCVGSLKQDKECQLYISEDDFEHATEEEDPFGYVVVTLHAPSGKDFVDESKMIRLRHN